MKETLLTIGEAAARLGVSINTLRLWDKKGILNPFRPTPSSYRYYRESDLERFIKKNDLVSAARDWVFGSSVDKPESLSYSQTRDTFQARIEHLQSELISAGADEKTASLVTAIAGEIGNNSFDHNLGNWPDVPGIFFAYDVNQSQVVLADRGQGILKTLRRVKPKLKNHSLALKTAFTEIISGRAPEARGNGLKFVRQIVTGDNAIRLQYQTGNALLHLQPGDQAIKIQKSPAAFRGCMAVITF